MASRETELEALVRRVSASSLTRRKFLAATGFTSMAAFIAACSGGGSSSSAPSAPASTTPTSAPPSTEASASAEASVAAPSPSYATEGALFMYNWADYINPENIETFKKRYNITDWTYDTYASNEEMMTKLQGGATGLYDVASPTCEFVPAMADQKFIEKLDFSRIPNAGLINDQFKKFFDPAGPQAKYNDYYMAKDWGTTGIALRSKFVKDEVKTWKQFFDVAPKYDGQIVVVKSAGDVLTAPLKALGYSLNSVDPKELGEARELLRGLAPHVLLLDSDHYEDSLRSGEAVLGLTWTGGLDELKAEPETADIQYHIPTDGTLYWLDVWTILTGAPHREAAYAFLNFIQEPEIQGKETNINYYATANDAAKKYVDPAILADPTVFVADDVIPKLEGAADVSTNPLRVEIWEEFVSSIGHSPIPRGATAMTATAPADSRRPARGTPRRRGGWLTALLVLPATAWYVILLVAPLAIIFVFSFGNRATTGGYGGGFTLDNYVAVTQSLGPFLTSLTLSILGTLLCLLVGLPLAYFIATRAGRRKALFIVLLVVPFWTSFLIRTYAWLLILGPEGIAGFLGDLVHDQKFRILGTQFGVLIGLVYGYLPLMVFPLYVTLERMDRTLVEASKDLGAGRWATFRQITLPIALPGLITGSILVFIPMMGEYVIPEILGYGQVYTIGSALVLRFLEARNWPAGSAYASVLILIMLVTITLYVWFTNRGRQTRDVSVL